MTAARPGACASILTRPVHASRDRELHPAADQVQAVIGRCRVACPSEQQGALINKRSESVTGFALFAIAQGALGPSMIAGKWTLGNTQLGCRFRDHTDRGTEKQNRHC